MKKLSSVLLTSLCMLMVLFLVTSFKVEAGNITSGTLGDNGGIEWTYDADTKTLTITGEDTGVTGDPYKGSIFVNICSDVEKIIVKDCTLYDCSYLFAYLKKVQSIVFENFNTSQVTDMSSMFSNCTSLTELDVSKFDTSQVTDMSSMFANCKSLTELDVSKFDTSQVTNMQFMFGACSGLTSLDLSKFDTSRVTHMDYMFNNCYKLTSLELSSFNTSQVINMGDMFANCTNLTELDLSKFDTSKVTHMYWMFDGCKSLTSLDLSSFDTSKVTDMREMFEDCYELRDIDVSSFDTSHVTNMSSMFADCRDLEVLDISQFDTSRVTTMTGMFWNCSKLNSLDVSDFDTSQVTHMNYMFDGCMNLSNLDLQKFNTSQVKFMNSMFANCTSLTELDMSNFDTSQVTNMDSMFMGCSNLSNLDLSNFDTSQVFYDLTGMFKDCTSLVELNISNFELDEVRDWDEMFSGCNSLEKIYTPKSMTAEQSIELPGTFVDEQGNQTNNITKAFCNKTLQKQGIAQVKAFVERMYTIVLNRPAEEQGLNDWTKRLMEKQLDGATLVNMFVFSDEFIARNVNNEEYIKILYRAVLGREADADGLKMWKELLDGEWTRDQLKDGFVLSDEFKALCDSYGIIAVFPTPDNPDNPDVPDEPDVTELVRDFVRRMYTVVLNRPAEEQGLNEWTQRLLDGTSNGAQVADGFISSEEFTNRNLSNEDYVKVLYRAFFNREADEGGFNVWMNELAKGASRRDVMKGFVHSVEFSDLCAQYGIIRGEIQ